MGITEVPNWPVDDVFYQGWGKVKNIDSKAKSISFVHTIWNISPRRGQKPVIRGAHCKPQVI